MKSPTLFLLGKIWSPRTFCAGTSPGTSPGDGFAGKKQTSRYTFSGVSGTAAHRDGFRQMCRRNLQCRPRDTAVGLWNENENILFSESPRQERRVFLHFPPILRGRFRFRSCLQAILLTCFKLRRFFHFFLYSARDSAAPKLFSVRTPAREVRFVRPPA